MRDFAPAMTNPIWVRILIGKDLPRSDPIEPIKLSDRKVLLELFEPGIDPNYIRLLVSEPPGHFIHQENLICPDSIQSVKFLSIEHPSELESAGFRDRWDGREVVEFDLNKLDRILDLDSIDPFLVRADDNSDLRPCPGCFCL